MKISVDTILQVQQNWTIRLILSACALKIPECELLEELPTIACEIRDHRLEQSRVDGSQVLPNFVSCSRAQIHVPEIINNKTSVTARAGRVWLVPVTARTSANSIEYSSIVDFLLWKQLNNGIKLAQSEAAVLPLSSPKDTCSSVENQKSSSARTRSLEFPNFRRQSKPESWETSLVMPTLWRCKF